MTSGTRLCGCSRIQHNEPADVMFVGAQIYKGKVYDFWNMFVWLQQVEGLRAYDRLFGPIGVGPLPDTADFICCAQFVVDRDTIRRWAQSWEFSGLAGP